MKNKKKINFIMVLLIPLFLFSLTTITVKADSGWDSDYGGGGYDSGSWSSSDWSSSSSSSWSSHDSSSDSWSSSSSRSSSESGPEDWFFSLVVILIIFLIWYSSKIDKVQMNAHKTPPEITEEEFHKYLPEVDMNEFKKELYDKFLGIQNAWMDFDYDKLKELCTDELYNSYKTQLEVLKIKNGQNIMNDFEFENSKITAIREDSEGLTVDFFLGVAFYDYVIDTTNNKVTRGKKNKKIFNRYNLVFTKNKNETSKKCPKCGAEITNATQTKCEYCHSEIVKSPDEFILSKKNII